MKKAIIAILTLFLALCLATPVMAFTPSIIATASGSAESGSASADTEAHVTVNGMLTKMYANVASSADGESATSESNAYGILYPWDYAEVGGYTLATATSESPATVSADANTYGKVKYSSPTTYTQVILESDADGDNVTAGAGVITIASFYIWDINDTCPGIWSQGSASATVVNGGSIATASYDAIAKAYPSEYPWFSYAATGGSGSVSDNNVAVKTFAVVAWDAPPPP